jgi:hypothetical protein
VTYRDWDTLSHIEQCFLVNAFEHDILAGALSDLDEDEYDLPRSELATVVLNLIDRGWVEARPYIPWTAPDGREGLTIGDLIPREEVAAILAAPETWDYGANVSWIGAVTLNLTDAGRRVWRGQPEEEVQP